MITKNPNKPHENSFLFELTYGKLLSMKNALDKVVELKGKLSTVQSELLQELNQFLAKTIL